MTTPRRRPARDVDQRQPRDEEDGEDTVEDKRDRIDVGELSQGAGELGTQEFSLQREESHKNRCGKHPPEDKKGVAGGRPR